MLEYWIKLYYFMALPLTPVQFSSYTSVAGSKENGNLVNVNGKFDDVPFGLQGEKESLAFQY